MTRKLVFVEGDQEKFALLYQGFLNGGTGQSRGLEVMRREARVLDKLDAISQPEIIQIDGKTVETNDRVPKLGEQVLLLEQPEYELLKAHFEATPWTTRVVRKVVSICDWLSAIPLEDNGV
jgi:hypothetical protein